MLCSEMDVRFAEVKYDRLEADPSYRAGFSDAVVKAFRKRMQLIRAARDERDFYGLKSLHYEKLAGSRQHQHSMRLNDQYRLIIEVGEHSGSKVVTIVGIEDYH